MEQPAVEKQEKPSEAAKEKKEILPDTGETESTNNAPLFGKRRKNSNDKQ